MKYASAITVIVIAFFLNNYLPIFNARLPFARVEPAYYACTLKLVYGRGSPFQTNLYDECGQDDSTHYGALTANVTFWAIVAYLTYKHVEKKTATKIFEKNNPAIRVWRDSLKSKVFDIIRL